MRGTFQGRAPAVILFLLLASCQSRVQQARMLIERGSLVEARNLLDNELRVHPDDVESRFLIGEIALRENAPKKAKYWFAPLLASDTLVWRVSQAYRDSVHRIEVSGDAVAMAAEATEAVHLNPLAAPDMCKALLGRARRDRKGNWWDTVPAAGNIDGACRTQTIALLRAWIDGADAETIDAENLLRMGTEAKRIDPAVAPEMARAIRAVAWRIAKVDRFRANDVVQRLGSIDPTAAYDAETAMLRSNVGPIEVHESSDEVSTRNYSGSPVEVTILILKELGQCATIYQGQHNEYPVANNFGDAWVSMRQYAQSDIQLFDAWGTAFQYMSDGKTARLQSAGADRNLHATSDNIIWENGRIVQPVPVTRY